MALFSGVGSPTWSGVLALAEHVQSVIKKLSHQAPIRAVAITGAERRVWDTTISLAKPFTPTNAWSAFVEAVADQRTDREALDSFVDIVVGTPARLLSHRDDGRCNKFLRINWRGTTTHTGSSFTSGWLVQGTCRSRTCAT